MTDPERFQVELQFSAGAAYDPFGLAPSQPHVLPIKPRFPLFQGAFHLTVHVPLSIPASHEASSAEHSHWLFTPQLC